MPIIFVSARLVHHSLNPGICFLKNPARRGHCTDTGGRLEREYYPVTVTLKQVPPIFV